MCYILSVNLSQYRLQDYKSVIKLYLTFSYIVYSFLSSLTDIPPNFINEHVRLMLPPTRQC